MQNILHRGAKTTPKIRKEIHDSTESLMVLAQRYNLNFKTILKWKHREDFSDKPSGAIKPKSVLSDQEQAVICEFRRITQLPLDDAFVALKDKIPALTRSNLYRCLKRFGYQKLPKDSVLKKERQSFKTYEMGRKLNNEQNIASKLFKPDQKDDKADKDAYMHQLTSRNIAYVGFKDELLANGANNVRHFVVGLAWGRFGTRIAQLEDRAQRFFGTRTGSRANQERTAEIASDRAAAGAYREFGRELDRDLRFWETKDSNEIAWKQNREKLANIWRKRFCR